jgi:hypothetical protein
MIVSYIYNSIFDLEFSYTYMEYVILLNLDLRSTF